MQIYFVVINIKANQHMFSGIPYKVYNERRTYICPNCKSNIKVRYKKHNEKIIYFLSKCELRESQVNPERACNGRYMICPHCGEKLNIDRHRDQDWKLCRKSNKLPSS